MTEASHFDGSKASNHRQYAAFFAVFMAELSLNEPSILTV